MKNLFLVCSIIIWCSCSGNNNSAEPIDSANAIEDHPIDTTIAPQPNGYAPPNTDVDTSQTKKDSIKARH